MRTYSEPFEYYNQQLNKAPRHVLELHGDTNTYYVLSHSDIVIPGVSSTYIIYSSFQSASVISQTLSNIKATVSLGSMSFKMVDVNSAITTMLTAIDALDESLRGRKLVFKLGYKGLDFSYFGTLSTDQLYGQMSHTGAAYTINGRDIDRVLLEKIFTPKTTTLLSSISKTETQIPVKLVTNFSMITHTAAFTDAPSETVGYFRIDDEIIRWTAKNSGTDYFTVDNAETTLDGATAVNATTLALDDASGFDSLGIGYIDDGANVSEIRWTGKSGSPANTLTGVTGIKYAHANGSTCIYSKGRGAFNTLAVAHDVDSGADDDRKPTVEEFIYLEMPVIQMALTLMTRTIYGTANTIPDHWGAGISTDWIATSTFDNIGLDIFDPTDDTVGFIGRIEGAKTVEALVFIREEIYRLVGLFDYILSNGQTAIKRMNEPLADSPYVRKLDSSQMRIDSAELDYDDIYNEFEILWNWNGVTEEFTRRLLLEDTGSKTKHQKAKRLTLSFKLLHGSRHTNALIKTLLDVWRSRHAGAPWKISITAFSMHNDIEIGDVIYIDSSNYRDFLGADTSKLSRAMELQRISYDAVNAKLKFNLFGATERASPLNLGDDTSPLVDGYFTADGTDLSGETTYFTDSGGVLHCDTNGYTMAGNADINNAAAHYYVDGDLTIDAGIGIDFTHNVLLKVNGYLTVNGYMNGAGAGQSGTTFSSDGAVGTAGFFGNTKSGGGLTISQKNPSAYNSTNREGTLTKGDNDTAPRLILVNTSGQLGDFPTDLRPSSGGSGMKSHFNFIAKTDQDINGGNGGAGGASLVIVCKGMAFGANGYIDTSGAQGSYGSSLTQTTTFQGAAVNINMTVWGGRGESGHPGAVWVLLAGNGVDQPDNQLVANYYSNENHGTHLGNGWITNSNDVGDVSSRNFHYTENRNQSCWIVQRVPDNQTPVEDALPTATVPTAINIATVTSNRNTINTEVLEITVDAPADTNYKSSAIYTRVFGADSFVRQGETNSSYEVRVYAGNDTGTIEIRAHPISKAGIESAEYIDALYTVASSTTTILNGNLQNDSDPSSNGGFQLSDSHFKTWDTSGNQTWYQDFSDGSILAGIQNSGIYFNFDASAKTFTIGTNVKQNNTNALESDCIFINDIISNLVLDIGSSGTWTITDNSGNKYIQNTTSNTSEQYSLVLNRLYDISDFSWEKDRVLEIVTKMFQTNQIFSWTTGSYDQSSKIHRHFGFYFHNDGNIYATWANGTTEYTQSLQAYSASGIYRLKAKFTTGTKIEFYVDDSLLHTISTTAQLPSGTTSAEYALYGQCYKSNSGNLGVLIGEIKMHQAP